MKFVIRKNKKIIGLTQMGWALIMIACIVGVGLYNSQSSEESIASVLDVETDIHAGMSDVYFKIAVKNITGDPLTKDVIVYAYDWNDNIIGSKEVISDLVLFSTWIVKEGSYIRLLAQIYTDDTTIASLSLPVIPTFRVGNGDPMDIVWAYDIETGEAVIYI